jgi:hypothetical protein
MLEMGQNFELSCALILRLRSQLLQRVGLFWGISYLQCMNTGMVHLRLHSRMLIVSRPYLASCVASSAAAAAFASPKLLLSPCLPFYPSVSQAQPAPR